MFGFGYIISYDKGETSTIGVLLTLLPVAWASAGTTIEQWTVKEYWQSLTPKMTEENVSAILGIPKEKEEHNDVIVWYYQSIPERQEGNVIRRPQAGFVRFRKLPDQICLVYDWEEPDWSTVMSHTKIQYLSDQKRIERQTKAEEAKRLQEEQWRLRVAESERIQAERQAEIERRTQEAEGLKAERLKTVENNPPIQRQTITTQPKDEYSLLNVHTKYWFAVAGIFVVMAILISVTFGFKR